MLGVGIRPSTGHFGSSICVETNCLSTEIDLKNLYPPSSPAPLRWRMQVLGMLMQLLSLRNLAQLYSKRMWTTGELRQ